MYTSHSGGGLDKGPITMIAEYFYCYSRVSNVSGWGLFILNNRIKGNCKVTGVSGSVWDPDGSPVFRETFSTFWASGAVVSFFGNRAMNLLVFL